MESNSYEDSDIFMELKEGIFYVSVKQDVLVDASVGERLVLERIKICNGISYPVILDVRGAKYWTMNSRNKHMQGNAFDCISFAAVVLGNKAVKIIWDFAVKLFPMPIKNKIFVNLEEAQQWVRAEMEQGNRF